jgi:hypothetical protein
MHGVDRDEVLCADLEPLQRLRADHPFHPAVDEVVAGSFRRRSPPAIVGSGYVVKSLEADTLGLSRCGALSRGRSESRQSGGRRGHDGGRLWAVGRGTAEQWIKEGKYALKWTRLSCRRFADNQVRLQLFALAYNLANFLRRLALPRDVKYWSLTTLREKLVKIGAKVTQYAKYVTFQMAEVAIPRQLFQTILKRIANFRLSTPRASPT